MRISQLVLILLIFFITNLSASELENLIFKGNESFSKYMYMESLDYFKKAIALNPLNYEARWKASRSACDAGNLIQEKNFKIELFKNAELNARKAVEISPDSAMGHFQLGVALGRIAMNVSSKEKIKLSKIIKMEFDKAVELDSNLFNCWHAIGRWNREIATLSWVERKFATMFFGEIPRASLEDAEKAFKKALSLDPNGMHHYVHIGITYEKAGKDKLAVDSYKKALSLKTVRPGDKKDREIAEKRLKELR